MSHSLAARLPGKTAATLGLPDIVDLTLRTDVEGVLGTPSFRLRHEWTKNGQRQLPQRTGAILETSDGLRRLPLWLMEAIEVAEDFRPGSDDKAHWAALARFRQALDPGVTVSNDSGAAKASMTDFLAGLQVRVADRFSVAASADGNDFEVVPFHSRVLERETSFAEDGSVSEDHGELNGEELALFQNRVRDRGALSAYRLGSGNYIVVDPAATTALEVMTQMQRAPVTERAAFIRNPRARITEAVEGHLRRSGAFDGLSEEAIEETVERAAGPMFVETREFSQRVIGKRVFEKTDLGPEISDPTTWMPEEFARRLNDALSSMSELELKDLRDRVEQSIQSASPDVEIEDFSIPARPEALSTIDRHLADRARGLEEEAANFEHEQVQSGSIVLDTVVNFKDLLWESLLKPRTSRIDDNVPPSIRTPLKLHQIESLNWQIAAWKAGLPGVLNADEQGLGKTLQTIAFLVWLKTHLADSQGMKNGPVLVVAPTSLLENWEQEVARHVQEPGLGHLIRLYGTATGTRKISGARGRDIETGEAKLDLDFLHEAIAEDRAHRFWILTTYTTLTNYQHSLAAVPFSTVVFDEIQAVKNPDSLRAHAARSINADFRIGLTGTPIENSAVDLWAIMDQLAPGSLESLKAFRQRYAVPDETNMEDLHRRVFKKDGARPPLALRRLKEEVAKDLPEKSRRLHPRLMPTKQAIVYEDARLKLANGGPGAALKMLHHIRTVSVHPSLDEPSSDEGFIAASGRVQAAFDVLRKIAAQGERALVFIEHRQMQYRFIELARADLKLSHIDLINGDTPIPKRQAIVNRFQRHIEDDRGFDLLVLGPKAAGTGLTLTAATHVIHLSRWWNPAVEEQCNDRVHRLGQTRPVTIHMPMAIHPGYLENSFDCLLHSLMQRKRKLAASALWPMGDTQGDTAELQKMLSAEKSDADADPLMRSVEAMFRRDGQSPPVFSGDGSVPLR